MNSTEPQSTSTTLTTMKIHPPLLAGGLLVVTLLLHFMLPESRAVGWEQAIGLIVVVAGAGVCSFGAASFQARETTKKPWGEPTALVAMPPYTWTRNPMYLGHLIFLTGLTLTLQSVLAGLITIVLAIWFHFRVRGDETKLAERLGPPYVDYTRSVNRWIPGLF